MIPIAYITAYEALLQFGGLQRDDWVLIAGASSGVGVAAIQIAKMCGAKVIGTSGSAEKLARLKALGLDAGIQTRGENFTEEALQITGGAGVKLAVNLVGGSAFAGCLGVLTDFGRLAVVGYVDGQMLTGSILSRCTANACRFLGFRMRPYRQRCVRLLNVASSARSCPPLSMVGSCQSSIARFPLMNCRLPSNTSNKTPCWVKSP